MPVPQGKEQEINPQENPPNPLPVIAQGDMFNSIEALSLVAQEITLDEIEDAADKSRLIVRRLSSLQTLCANLTAIKQFVVKAQAARLCIEEGREPEREMPRRHPEAGNPNGEIDKEPEAADNEELPTNQRANFTLGETRLREKAFELGYSPTRSTDEELSDLGAGRYAAIVGTPGEIAPAGFSIHEESESAALPAPSKASEETLPPGLFDQVIDHFTAFVGPMAGVILEEQIAHLGESFTAFPRSRLDELITLIGREIPDNQSQVRFQKQVAEKIRTLLPPSAASLASARNKK